MAMLRRTRPGSQDRDRRKGFELTPRSTQARTDGQAPSDAPGPNRQRRQPSPINPKERGLESTGQEPQAVTGGGQNQPQSADSPAAVQPESPTEVPAVAGTPSPNNDEPAQPEADDNTAPRSSLTARLAKRKKWLVIGGAGGGIVGLLIAAFIAMLPLKIEGIVKMVSSKAFAGVENALERRTEVMVEHYVAKSVFPGIRSCGSTRNAGCGAASRSTNAIAGRLFENWRQGKFEQRLWEKHGIAFEYNANSKKHYVITRSGTTEIADPDNFKVATMQTQARREFNDGVRKTTRWFQFYKRHSLRKMGRIKYGFTRWNVFGERRDELREKHQPAQRVKLAVARRVAAPLSPRYGAYLECIIKGCSNGSEFHAKLRAAVGDAPADELVDALSNGERGRDFLLRKMLEPLVTKFGITLNVNAIPVAGQIISAIMVVDILERVDEAVDNNMLSMITADLYRMQYATYFLDLATFNDEMKAGQLELAEVGAKADMLGSPTLSRIYQRQFANNPGSNVPIVCENGEALAEDQLVCPEMGVVQRNRLEKWRDNSVVDFVISQSIVRRYECIVPTPVGCLPSPISVVRPTINAVDWLAGKVLGGASLVLDLIPGISDLKEDIETWTQNSMMSVMKHFFAPPLTGQEKDAAAFDQAYAGSLVVANDYAAGDFDGDKPVGIGGKALTATEARANQEQRLAMDAELAGGNRIARLFNPTYSGSVFARIAYNMPTSVTGAAKQLSPSALASALTTGIAKLFLPSTQAAVVISNPFGILDYGYPVGDADLNIDPDTLTDEWCANRKQQRESSKRDLDNDGIEDYTMTDPCMLETMAVEAAGGFFGLGEYGSDDAAGNTGATAPPPTSDTLPGGTAAELTAQLRANPKVSIAGNITGLDRRMLAVLVALSNEYGFVISSAKRGCFGEAGCGSRHVAGLAADIQLVNGIGPSRNGGYAQYHETVNAFVARAGALLPGPSCEIGVPNNLYLANARISSPQCKVLLDIPSTTGATSPHIHLAVPR